ncbi:MAG TPA: CopD family protein [Candidatus Dormibacteraeota bacterium]
MNLPSIAEIAVAAVRWVEYAGLLGFMGVVVIRRLAGMQPTLRWARVSMVPALSAAFVGGLGVIAAGTLRTGHIDVAVVARVALEGVALGLCVYVGRSVVPPAVAASVALPFGGHAALAVPAIGAIFADAVHILGAGMWAGSILVLATLRPPGGWGGEDGRALLRRFAPVAFLAFAITAMTGLLQASAAIGDPSNLFNSPYGLVLAAKTAGVLVMVAISAFAWRRGWRFARVEGVVVLLVLAATAVLAAFPIPPQYLVVELAGR